MQTDKPDLDKTITMFFGPEHMHAKVDFERQGHQIYIWINGQYYAAVDLFYYSEEHRQGTYEVFPALQIYQPGEVDTLGSVHWRRTMTIFHIDRGPIENRADRTNILQELVYKLDDDLIKPDPENYGSLGILR